MEFIVIIIAKIQFSRYAILFYNKLYLFNLKGLMLNANIHLCFPEVIPFNFHPKYNLNLRGHPEK